MEQKYSSIQTLSKQEVNLRLHKQGLNTIPLHIKDLLLMSFKNLRTPIILIDISILAIAMLLNAHIESLLILLIIILQFILSLIDMYLLTKYLYKRDRLNPPMYKVIREDIEEKIKIENLVEGDLLLLKSGDMVPADCYIIKAENLSVDESLISDTSFPVIKVAPRHPKRHNRTNILYAHTFIVSGNSAVRVVKTGKNVKYCNKIAQKLYQKQLSELDHRSNKTLNLIMLTMLMLILLFILILLLKGQAFDTQSILLILSLIISTIPTLFPLLSSLTLLNLVTSQNRQGLTTIDLNSFEKLAQVDIICFDKSGTLTSNELEVVDYETPLKEEYFLTKLHESSISSKDPFDIAIQRMLQNKRLTLSRDVTYQDKPFDPYLKNSSRRFEGFTIIKGSPEQVLSELQIKDNLDLALKIKTRSQIGERIISLIMVEGKKVKYLGTIFFKDQLKLNLKEKLISAKASNINLLMISGDNLNTSSYTGIKMGIIDSENEVIEASKLQFDSPKILKSQLQNFRVIARADPVDKYKIIEALEIDHNLAFMGEGVNDIPSLKISHISIVSENSSELIKKYSNILISQKDLGLVLSAVYGMRNLLLNLKKYIEVSLITGFSLLASTFLIILTTGQSPITPIQILLIEIVFFLASLDFLKNINTKEVSTQTINFAIREKKVYLPIIITISIIIDLLLINIIRSNKIEYVQSFWFLVLNLKNLIMIFIGTASFDTKIKMIVQIIKILFLFAILITTFYIYPSFIYTVTPTQDVFTLALISGLAYAIVLLISDKILKKILNINYSS